MSGAESCWIDPDVQWQSRNDRVTVSFGVPRSVRSVNDVLLHITNTTIVAGARGEKAKIRGPLLHSIDASTIATPDSLSGGRFVFSFFSKLPWPTLLDSASDSAAPRSRFRKYVVALADSGGGLSSDSLALPIAVGDVLGVLRPDAGDGEFTGEQVFGGDGRVGLVASRLVRECSASELETLASFEAAAASGSRLCEWATVNSDKKLWVLLHNAVVFLFSRDMPSITPDMLRRCDPRAQRRLDSASTVKVNDKHPKVVELTFGSGKKVTLKFPAAATALDWRNALHLAIRKLAWHEMFVAQVKAEAKRRAAAAAAQPAADRRKRSQSSNATPAVPVPAAAPAAAPVAAADDDDDEPPPPPSISPLARANSLRSSGPSAVAAAATAAAAAAPATPPATNTTPPSTPTVSNEKLDQLRAILLRKVAGCHEALLQRRATIDAIAQDESERMAIVTHLAAPVKRLTEMVETPRHMALAAVRERLAHRSKLDQLVEHVLALFDYQLLAFQDNIRATKSVDDLRALVKVASFVLEHAGRVLEQKPSTSQPAPTAAAVPAAASATAAAPPVRRNASDVAASPKRVLPLAQPGAAAVAPPEPDEDDETPPVAPPQVKLSGSGNATPPPPEKLQRAKSSIVQSSAAAAKKEAATQLATEYRVRKMALVGRIGLIQQRVKTGEADDSDIMQLAQLQTELSDLDARIASEDARSPRVSVPLHKLQRELDEHAAPAPAPKPRAAAAAVGKITAPSSASGSPLVSPRQVSQKSANRLKEELEQLEQRLASLEATADTDDASTLRALDALRSRIGETRAAMQRAKPSSGGAALSSSSSSAADDSPPSLSVAQGRELRDALAAAASAAADAEAAAVVNAAFADVIKSPLASPVASPRGSPRGSPQASPRPSRRRNVTAGSSSPSLRPAADVKKETKELDKQLVQMQQMIEALQKLTDAERTDLAQLKANRKIEEDAIADLKQKRKAEAARLRSLQDKARRQEEALQQQQKSGVGAVGSPAQLARSYTKTREALEKLPPTKSMVAAVIDESLTKPASPRAAAAKSSPARVAGKNEAEVAKLRATIAELQLRRGILQASLVDIERSLGKKKDAAQLSMVAEFTMQLSECDERTKKLEAEIVALQTVSPEERMRELLDEVRGDVKTMKKLARLMTEALPNVARVASGTLTSAPTPQMLAAADVEQDPPPPPPDADDSQRASGVIDVEDDDDIDDDGIDDSSSLEELPGDLPVPAPPANPE